ncbi:MAG: hypothetical protein ABIO45_18030 [Burkholderiaceae bacterium]
MQLPYRKTARGQLEIDARVDRLAPRLRTTLILVDGKRDGAALARLCPGDCEAALATLLAGGYIESLAHAAPPGAGLLPAAAAAAPALPAAKLVAQRSEPTGLDPRALAQLRRDVVRHLIDRLGPMVEGLAMRIEKSANAEQLLPHLQRAYQLLRDQRGAAMADEFEQRFVAAVSV